MSDNIIRKIVPFVMSLTMVLTLMPNGLFLDTYATENIQWNDILTNNPYLNSENKGIAIHEDYKVENSSYSENSYSATVSVTSEYLPHTTEPQDVAFIIDPYSYNNQNIEIANFLYQADYILNANNQSRVAVYGVSSNSEDRVELDFTRDKNAILTAITDAVNSVFETNIPNYWVLSMNNVYEDVLKSELKHHKSIIISSSYISRDDDEESPIIEYWNILKKLVPDIYFQKINYNSSDLKENERIKLARYRESLIKAIGTNEAINITTKFELNDDIYDFTSLDIESLTSLRKGCMEEFTFGYDISRDSQCTKGDNEYKVFKESYITADGNKIDFANERHNITAYNIVYQNPSSMTAITGDLPTDHTVVIDGSTFVLPYVNLSCDGFSMQGWETFSGDFYPFGSKTIIDSQIATNDNTIILTSAWSKPGGLLVSEKADVDAGQIESGSIYSICDKYDENLDHTVSQVQAIEFVQTNPPTNAKYVDVSSNKTGTVLMWTAIDSLTGYTTLYISGCGGDVISNGTEYIFAKRYKDNGGDYISDMWPAIKRIEGLKYFDVRAEKNMFSAFYGLTELEELDVSEFDTSGVESMAHMFSYCSKLKSDVLNQIDTSSAINMTYMFRYCSAFEKVDLSNIDTSNVKTMQGMFHSCIHIKTADLSSVDTGNVEIMSSMFDACSQLTSVDLTGVDTSKLTNIGSMFFNCQQLTSVNFGTAFEENIITNISYLFYFCRSLTKVDVSKFNTSNVTNMKFMFSRCSSLENLDITNFDTGNVTYMQSLFSECKKLSSISIDSTKFVTSKVTDMNSMFKDCEKLSSLDISSFSTSNVTDMNNMFYNCELLQKLDLNSFNTSKVTNMSSMFYNCNGLFELDLSNFNTSQVTNMSAMFYNCKSFTELDLSNFNTSQVTDMSNMFGMNDENNKLSKLVLSSFITSQVTDMSNMFENGKNLTELDLSNFDTSEVTKMSYMFRGCGFENIGDTGLIINKFNTSKVTDMNNMFWFCDKAVTIDLTTTENVDGTYCWDTSNVTNMNQMFSHCYMATSIVIDHWSSESILNFDNVFSNCTSIENLDISSMQFPQIYLEAVSTMNIITGCKSLDEMIVFSQHIEDKIDTTGLSVKIVVADSVANSFPLGDANYAPSIADNSINNSIEDTIQENFFDEPIDTYTVVTAPESESSDYKNITSSDTINYGLVLTGTVINYKVVIRPVVEESTNNTRSGVITVTNTLPKEVEFNKKTDNGENFVFRYNIYKRGTFNDVEPVIPTNSSAVVVGGPAGIVYDDATRTITAKVSGLAADEELVFYYSTTVTANPQGECYYVPIQNQYTMEENGIKVFSNSTLHYLKKAVDAVSTYEASYSYDNTCTEIAPHTEIHKSSEQFTLPTPVTVAGYTFNGWLCDYNSLTYSQDTTFTMPAENVHFTGSYTKNTVTQTFTLSYKYILEGNKVEVETYNYPVGVYKLITDEVIGEKNYYDYNDSYVYNDNIGAVTIEIDTVYFDKDVTVTRNFTRKPYTITWLDFDGNTSQTESYKWGDKTIAVAEPSKENYIFQNWIDTETGETAVSLDQDGTFIVPQRDVILKPIYIENPTYILTYQVREEGEGIWFSTIEYNEGEVVTLSDLPSLGFRIGEEWILDDTLLENGETVQITMVDGKQTLTMPKSNVTVYVDKINLIVPNTGISVDYSQWIGITGISLALLIIKNRFRKRGGAYGRK